ncbi:MAG: hypothetical protein PW845_09385 [Pseudomonas sp.]|nr:hypothetical protein [Pseudomonas sp.]
MCITVFDIDAALEFYCGVLGLESIGKLRHERAPGEILGFPNQIIEIHADHLVGKDKENATVIDLIEFLEPKTDFTQKHLRAAQPRWHQPYGVWCRRHRCHL